MSIYSELLPFAEDCNLDIDPDMDTNEVTLEFLYRELNGPKTDFTGNVYTECQYVENLIGMSDNDVAMEIISTAESIRDDFEVVGVINVY